MSSGLAITAALLSLGAYPASPHAAGSADRYELDFRDTASMSVAISARVGLRDGVLHIGAYTTQQPGYWRSRVSQLAASDSTGRALTLEDAGPTSWRVIGDYRGEATLRYVVDYSYAARPFPSGNQKGGLSASGAVYLVTRPLFITPDSGVAAGERIVRLVLAPRWRAATPWRSDSAGVCHALNRRDLAENSLVVGHFAMARTRRGGFEATAAFIGPIAADSATIGPAFTKVVDAYFRLFPRTPAARYLMTFFYADHDDGEAFASSSTVTFGHRIAGGDGILFNNKIAHEVLHYWIGQRIRGADFEHMSWMAEGFTEYLANRTIFETGLIGSHEYLEKLSRHLGAYGYYWYSPLFENRSLFAGGADKTRNRFGVYDGGAVAALCIDLQLRLESNGARSIDDVLRLLWDRYGASVTPFSLDDFSSALVEVGGPSFRDFVTRYVQGHELLPFEELLGRVGMRVRAWPLSAEAYLTVDAAASPARRTMRDRIFLRARPD